MKDKWIVYLHINTLNSKTYVGITHHYKNPNKRWGNGKGYRKSSIVYKAIEKYGWDNFKHIVLCETSKKRACMLETALISLYKRRDLSYNIGLGGKGSQSFSEETKNKLRQYSPWIKGKHHTEETKKKIGLASSSRTMSLGARQKISRANSAEIMGCMVEICP